MITGFGHAKIPVSVQLYQHLLTDCSCNSATRLCIPASSSSSAGQDSQIKLFSGSVTARFTAGTPRACNLVR